MAATDTFLARAEPWLRANIRDGLRAVLPLPVLALSWWFARMTLGTGATVALIVYALINLGVLVALRRANRRHRTQRGYGLIAAASLSDALLVAYLLFTTGPLTLGIFPIYTVMVLKALRYRRLALWPLLVPALLGPLYLAISFQRIPLSGQHAIAFWGLVGGSVFFITMLLALAEYRLFVGRRLSRRLEQARAEHEERVAELESVNNDLRVRIRRQRPSRRACGRSPARSASMMCCGRSSTA